METNLTAAVYPVCYVRCKVMDEYKIPVATWNYHGGKMPGPDIQMSGYEWYSADRVAEVMEYWMGVSSVRRRMATKAVSQVAGA